MDLESLEREELLELVRQQAEKIQELEKEQELREDNTEEPTGHPKTTQDWDKPLSPVKKYSKPPKIKIDSSEASNNENQRKTKAGQINPKKYKKSKSSINLLDQERSSTSQIGLKNKSLRRRQSMQHGSHGLISRKTTLASMAKNTEMQQAVNSEVKADNDSEKYAILLMSRVDILCYKFIENIRKRIATKNGKKYESLNETDGKKFFFTEMINIDDRLAKKDSEKTDDVIDNLDKYIESLNLNKDESNDLEVSNKDNCNDKDDVENEENIDTASAWGRRIFNDSEIDAKEEEQVASRFMDEPVTEELATTKDVLELIACTEWAQLQKLGLWDIVYDSGILTSIEKDKKLKPWLTNKIDLDNELRRLGLKKSDLRLGLKNRPVILDTVNNPVDRLTAKYLDTGSYLRPHDMLFCTERTKFSEDKIVAWFKKFRKEVPNGKLTRHHLKALFQKVFPDGNASKMTAHIFRIFDSDGNDFLDFKEFLMAIDIANRATDEDKLIWAFRLYDMDNNGVIDVDEMANIIETLDAIEGVKPGLIRYDENGNPVPILETKQRAEELFDAIDKDSDGSLDLEEFIDAYKRRTEILKKQDAMEQRKKLYCLIIYGPLIQRHNDFSEDKMIDLCEKLFTSRVGVDVRKDDIAHVELKSVSTSQSVYTRSIFVRFYDLDLRMKIWHSKGYAEKNKVFMEEWLTDFRSKLMKKCKRLLASESIVNVKTKDGDIIVLYRDIVDGNLAKKVVTTQESYDQLLVLIGKVIEDKLDIDKLDSSASFDIENTVENSDEEDEDNAVL